MEGVGPRPDFASQHSTTVSAPPERCYECLWGIDFGRHLFMRILLVSRGLGRLRTLRIALRLGFILLDEDPPHHLALGIVGRPWRPTGELQHLSPAEFHAFNRPGFVKVVWEFTFAPTPEGCAVSTSTEIFATDERARRRFGRYWRIVGPGSSLLRRSMLRSIARCALGAPVAPTDG